jgi:DNA mismatch endonuclease, patch repair protein
VILVHGCFWHSHRDPNCWRARVPKTRRDFWIAKLKANVARDARNFAELRERGWEAMVIWECQMMPRRLEELKARIVNFLR